MIASRPKDRWPFVPLGTLAEFRNGVNFSKANFGSGIKVIGVGDFQNNVRASFDSLEQINPEGVVRKEHLLKNEDILFVRSNGNRDLIGRSMFVDGLGEGITHSAFSIRLRFVSEGCHPRFYAYLFRSLLIRQALSLHGGGTNISNLNQDILGRLQVPLPPKSVQCKIASILAAYDDLIENNTRRIKILEEMAKMIYREWFVNFRFPGHEKVVMVESDIGEIPQGWTVKSLRELTTLISRGISPKYDDDANGLVVNQKCIRDGSLRLDHARKQSKDVPENKVIRLGDVLINSTGVGTLGRVAQVLEPISNCTVDSHVSIVRPQNNSEFLGKTLLQLEQHFERLGTGSTGQTELSRERIGSTKLIVPTPDLQERFCWLVAPMNRMIVCCLARNSNLRETRDFLLPKLICGEVSVTQFEAHALAQGI
jgi:type I restriction enzyme, S subunit